MDKTFIAYMRKTYPRLFDFVTRSSIALRIATELDRVHYIKCLVKNEAYLGVFMLAAQTWKERKPFMRQLVKSEIQSTAKENYTILEIGSWAGDSAILWANTIKEQGRNGLVICIDQWEPFVQPEHIGVNAGLMLMNRALRKGKILKLFLHNIRATHNEEIIKPYKGSSDQLVPTLRDNSFDLTYIDGSHAYSDVMKDLHNVSRVIRDGGIVCGDDLELQIHEIDVEYAEKSKDRDFIMDPRTKRQFHPGVCLAVGRFFGEQVSCYEGFWVMRKTRNGWQNVDIRVA